MDIKTIDRGNGLTELVIGSKVISIKRKRWLSLRNIMDMLSYVLMAAWSFGLLIISTLFRYTHVHIVYYAILSACSIGWFIINYLLERRDK